MTEKIITSIGGVGVFGVISICLFVTVFTGALLWAFFQKRSFLSAMESLPLQDDASENQKGTNYHGQ